jgi:hypothetical protein
LLLLLSPPFFHRVPCPPSDFSWFQSLTFSPHSDRRNFHSICSFCACDADACQGSSFYDQETGRLAAAMIGDTVLPQILKDLFTTV